MIFSINEYVNDNFSFPISLKSLCVKIISLTVLLIKLMIKSLGSESAILYIVLFLAIFSLSYK